MAGKKDWYVPPKSGASEAVGAADEFGRGRKVVAPAMTTRPAERAPEKVTVKEGGIVGGVKKDASGRIEIDPDDLGFGKILKR